MLPARADRPVIFRDSYAAPLAEGPRRNREIVGKGWDGRRHRAAPCSPLIPEGMRPRPTADVESAPLRQERARASRGGGPS